MNCKRILLLIASAAVGLAASASADPPRAIAHVFVDLANLHKWDASYGDTWDPFWADDDNLYSFNCDGRGFGTQGRNLAFNEFSGPALEELAGRLVNSMDEFGKSGFKRADNATWKVCGQECVDGIFYAFVARNVYGKESGDGLMRQTSFNSSLIKSTDHGLTWTRDEAANFEQPMWPSGRFGAPGFFHFGKDSGSVYQDGADKYVYAISNNGFWNGGDFFVLGRVARGDLPRLAAADWSYYAGGDGGEDGAWSKNIEQAKPVFDAPARCGWTSPAFIPALQRYLLVSWYVVPTLKKWFEPDEVKYDFLQAEHPWGPWTFIDSFSDRFLLPGQHMYGPTICAKFQQEEKGGVRVALFTSGCPFEDKLTGLYKCWELPLILQTAP